MKGNTAEKEVTTDAERASVRGVKVLAMNREGGGGRLKALPGLRLGAQEKASSPQSEPKEEESPIHD